MAPTAGSTSTDGNWLKDQPGSLAVDDCTHEGVLKATMMGRAKCGICSTELSADLVSQLRELADVRKKLSGLDDQGNSLQKREKELLALIAAEGLKTTGAQAASLSEQIANLAPDDPKRAQIQALLGT